MHNILGIKCDSALRCTVFRLYMLLYYYILFLMIKFVILGQKNPIPFSAVVVCGIKKTHL